MEIISFFLPIRKNSKRIKNKSFRPLYQYELGLTELKIIQFKKIKALFPKQLKNFKPEFIVSSDSAKVKSYIKKFKWIKFHKRSKWLSSDNSLDNLIKIVPKICAGKFILWTHVTSPLFDHKDYIKFIVSFLKSKKKVHLQQRLLSLLFIIKIDLNGCLIIGIIRNGHEHKI